MNRTEFEEQNVRAIAYHLPQFHRTPENDEWWGKGFTEWTNVTRAKPRFPGHYQPHLPQDLGFYDLRVPEARAEQAELASKYGIYGFFYYHYWFHGHQLLERPVNDILQSGEPNFPFCLCWANESWTRRWHAKNDTVLIEQRYSEADDLAHIHALIPFFLDRRYIRVMDRPLFGVYRASRLPEPRRTTELWRREAERAGLKGLFLVRVQADLFERSDPRPLGFDCSVDFQPDWAIPPTARVFRRKWWHRHKLRTGESGLRDNLVLEYQGMVTRALAQPATPYPVMPCVCPGWDNTPRRQREAMIFANATPDLYEHWLCETVDRLKARVPANGDSGISPESLVFINAWNEWAEGNHLEPCQKWGHAYLEATRRALKLTEPGISHMPTPNVAKLSYVDRQFLQDRDKKLGTGL